VSISSGRPKPENTESCGEHGRFLKRPALGSPWPEQRAEMAGDINQGRCRLDTAVLESPRLNPPMNGTRRCR
jgi:hypothetical protein